MTAEAPPITRRSLSRRRTSWARRWLRRSLWSLLALGVLGGIGLFIAYTLTSIPEPNGRALQQRSTIYYSDGKTVLDTFAEVNRQIVPINRVPKPVQYAFLAAEDRSFYRNNGISPKGIARSVWVGLKGGPQQGGSTITQQYVKNYFLTQDRTVTRKAKEILISIKIDKELPKDRILESYLNTIYFGRGADGIQTAAQAYFGTGVENLDVAQGAVLASVIRGPSLYDPGLGPEQLALVKERWVYVLDGMVDSGWLTASARASLTFRGPAHQDAHRGSGPGFVVKNGKPVMSKLKLTEATWGGLRLPDRHDDRQAGPGLGPRGGHGAHARRDLRGAAARRPRRRCPRRRRDQGALWRPEVRHGRVGLLQHRHPGRASGRVHLQGMDVDRRLGARPAPVDLVQCALAAVLHRVQERRGGGVARGCGRSGRQLRQPQLRGARHDPGDRTVGEHVLRPAQHRSDPEAHQGSGHEGRT